MKKLVKNLRIYFVLSLSMYSMACAMAPNNFFAPYDPNYRLPLAPDTRFRVGINAEHGSTRTGRNLNHDKSNILQIYDCTQSTIAMVMMPTCQIKNNLPIYLPVLTSWAGSPTDDGFRGRIQMTGEFEQTDVTVYGSYIFYQRLFPGDL